MEMRHAMNAARHGEPASPRVFCIPATRAPIVAVLRRRPSAWSHLGRWDLARLVYEPGAWIRGNLYPQRCDLSPDGRWFCYFTLKGSARWRAGATYVAVSRLPWLAALAAWRTCGTWTRGLPSWRIMSGKSARPMKGMPVPAGGGSGSRSRPASFAVERGEARPRTADCPGPVTCGIETRASI